LVFRRQERQRQQGWVVLRFANILSLFERIVFLNYYFKIIDSRKLKNEENSSFRGASCRKSLPDAVNLSGEDRQGL
jgi:hypothetical protein